MERELITLFQGKENCCGCGACAQKCPKGCISFDEDKDGFLYPSINDALCINCGLCIAVCPFHEPFEARYPQRAYAAYNKDDLVRRGSSSGGVFSLLARKVLEEGGVVFGAMFDEQWSVVHGFIETVDELPRLRGSKYVQSYIGRSYEVAEQFLRRGRRVLFCGTPCQIAGLKKYLRMDYENLVLVDFICHGVPSPKLWRWYLNLKKNHTQMAGINFRNKDNGWKRYCFAIDYCDGSSSVRTCHEVDPYMIAFLNDMSLRQSCSSCKVKSGRSNSDLTLADFWNVDKIIEGIDDDKGLNLVLENSSKGAGLLSSVQDGFFYEVDFPQAIQFNKAWNKSYSMHPNRDRFFSSYHKYKKDFDGFVRKTSQSNVGISMRLKRILKSLLLKVKR